MKLKNILGIALSALLFTACSEDDPIGNFGTLTVDNNFVTMSTSESSATVKVTAASDWTLENLYYVEATIDGQKKKLYYPVPVALNKDKTEGVPSWLTVDKTSGAAGETVLTLHAGKTEAGRETEICINMGGLKQFVKVRQGELTASQAKCAEIMAGTDGKNYRVTGRVTKIANYGYGNWFLDDGSYDFASTAKNQDGLYIYGTLDKKGKAGNISPIDGADGWGFEVGDVVTVEGPLSIYNGQYELVNVNVVSIVKSLLKVITPEQELEKDGGQIEVRVAYKGSGAYYTIADNAKSWINYESVSYKGGTKTIFDQNPSDTAIFKFNVIANTQEKRTGAITFASYSGKNSSQIAYTVTQKGVAFPPAGKGTKDDPFNVTAALNYTTGLGLGNTSANDVYVKGIISSIKYTYSADYGTATYNISADGKENDVFVVYNSYFFDNKKWQEGQTQIAVGDEVIVCGKVIYYNDTKNNAKVPEFSSKANWLYSINGKTSEGGDEVLATELSIDFTAGQGDWTIKDVALDEGVSFVWKVDNTYGMKATAYVSGASHPTDSWLVSPAVKLDKEATLAFEQALNKGTQAAVKVMMSTTYAGGAINPTEWTELTLDQWPAGNNWNYLTSTAKVPAAAKVYIAFRYNSTATDAPTWEIKTLSLK